MVSKSSLNERFASTGKPRKVKSNDYEKIIYYDTRQYSIKIPKLLMDKIHYKKGDKIIFTLNKPDDNTKDIADCLEIKYVRGKNAK